MRVDARTSVGLMTGPIERAREVYERAVFGGDTAALDLAERDLDEVEAALALARGRILHARFLDRREEDPYELALFERATQLYHALGDRRGEAEALFWVGCFHQVVRDNETLAVPAFQRSYELADGAGDKLTLSYATRHLAFVAQAAGRKDEARQRFEESVRLRREIGFRAGVAAGLVALAELAVEEGRTDEARELLTEAESTARDSGAYGTLRWVEEARAALG
jgi:tetratricopeptide (TPR) repeat protein